MATKDKLSDIRHTLAHLLAAAVIEIYPDAKPTIGPAIDNGFYYDFEFASPITNKDLPNIENKMKKLLKNWKDFTHQELNEKEAKKYFENNIYKLELIDEIVEKKEKITLYTSGGFTDLCRGGHVENPSKEITPDSFKLSHIAGAYWRGDEKNKMLTRIYGLAFTNKAELDAYTIQIEEAKKRDHKKLGKELDLFVFSDLIGSGLPLWTPKGTLVRDLLDDFIWELRSKRGYVKVTIPHITKKDLYLKSGHWDKYKDDLFKITTREKHEFAMKPMSCPHHTQIFDRKPHSYKEMPQRYAETTMVYRDEQSGELSGLSRVLCITQDDAHVFCRISQVKQEIQSIWEIVHIFYSTFNLPLKLRLSLRDPQHPEKYLGNKDHWDKAEEILKEIAKENKTEYYEGLGEAAFYAPKLDFIAKDSLGRELQVATIQLDVNMPERFDLSCTNEKGQKERIVMIHAAIMGATERFMSVMIEHLAGNFPLWLSPVQIKIIPVSEAQSEQAQKIHNIFRENMIRSDIDLSSESFGKKIRNAKTSHIPYTIIIGAKDIEANKVTLESRDHGQIGQLSIEDVLKKLKEEIALRK